jgi:hypothetical protein
VIANRYPYALVLGSALAIAACGGGDITIPSDGEPAHITVTKGNEQRGRVGSTLTDSLVVKVTDTKDRAVAGASVAFAFTDGSGQVSPSPVTTGANGEAASSLTLGSRNGLVNGTAEVAVKAGVAPVIATFTATALPADANGIVAVSGDDQSAPVGSDLPAPLVVKVTDAFGNPIPGVSISWTVTGGGSVSPETTVTGVDGQASVTRTLGPIAAPQTTVATTASELAGSPLTFHHTATAGSANRIEKTSGDAQEALVGTELTDPLVVRVFDADNNPIPNEPVTWVPVNGQVPNGGNTTTDAQGYANIRWTLGLVPGTNTLTAVASRAGTSTVTFTATGRATPGPVPTQIALNGGDNQTSSVNSTLPVSLSVKVTSATGEPVSGVTVTWNAAGGGSVSSATSSTGTDGVAQVQRTLGSTPGQYTTTATVTGLAGSPVTFASTATAGSATVLVIQTQPSATATVNVVLDRQPVIQLKDAAGNDVSTAGVRVTATIQLGDGTLEGSKTKTTDGTGRAIFTNLKISGATGSHTLIFAATGFQSATSDPIDVQKGSTTTHIDSDNPDPSLPNEAVTIGFTVSSTSGTPTGDVTVTASPTVPGESCTATVAQGSCQITFSAIGERSLTATYVGDNLFNGSISGPAAHSVTNPVANPDSYTTPKETTLTVGFSNSLLQNDRGPAGAILSTERVAGSEPTKGTIRFFDSGGTFDYTPNAGETGTDTFRYLLRDSNSGLTNEATVTINITP